MYLKIESPDEEEQIDLLNIASAMGKRRKLFFYLMALAACVGICLGLVISGVRYLTGKDSCASAVVNFQYEGIEEGLDPNGAAFDVNKIKSPVVIGAALEDLGMTDISVEDVRRNIVIEGVVPEDALQRITVINKMASDDASNYEKVLDVSYFPSQYIVHLYKGDGMSSADTVAILNAVLDHYRDFFLETYANTEVLSVTSRLIDYTEYDYMESVEMLQSQIDIMQDYVAERREQAPDFRSSGTGLAFGDIEASLEAVEEIELSKIASYIESAALTKDRENFEEQYSYKIRKYNMRLSELQAQLATVEATIETYVKDPVVIVSSQESTQQISQKNEYYDTLVERKLTLNTEIASINTDLNEAYELWNRVMASDAGGNNAPEDWRHDVGMGKADGRDDPGILCHHPVLQCL